MRFIVEEALEGRVDGLTEWVIGIDVFAIKDFDPKVHPNVRVEATRLRRRLRQYYETEGRHDGMHIEVPEGGYRPVFRLRRLVHGSTSFAIWRDHPTGSTFLQTLGSATVHERRRQSGQSALLPRVVLRVAGRLGELERFWVASPKIVVDSGVQTVEEAYRSFGVNLVVTGSMERASEKVRITITLNNKDRPPRSRTTDSQTGQPFDLQDEVVNAVIASWS